jgi:hypothetical protein
MIPSHMKKNSHFLYVQFQVAPEDYIWTMFFTMLPGSFQSALLANINHRKSISQPNSTVTSANSHGLGQGVVHFSRNIMVFHYFVASYLQLSDLAST